MTVNSMNDPNVKIIENFVSDPEVLLETLMADVTWESQIKARKTASFGVPYNYSGLSYPARAMHPGLVPIVNKIFVEQGWWPNNCLLNMYSTGSKTIGFHTDDELTEGTGVVIISLGAEREIVYRNIRDRTLEVPYPLPCGSFLYMGNDVQEEWLHGLPKLPGAGLRISLTFRKVFAPGG